MTFPESTALLQQVCGAEPPPAPAAELRLCLELAADEANSPLFLADTIADTPSVHRRFLILANHFRGDASPARNAAAACRTLSRQQVGDWLWILALTDVLHCGPSRPRRRLWCHSLLTAVIADAIGEHLKDPPDAPVWAAGMAHDVGHLLVHGPGADHGVDWHFEHDRLADQKPGPSPERNHCLIGAELLRLWHAPATVVATAKYHHQPATAPPELQPLIAHVRLADVIAEHVDSQIESDDLFLDQTDAWQLLADSGTLQIASPEQLLAEVLIPAEAHAERLAGLLAK